MWAKKISICSGTDNAAITDFIFCYSTNQSFKQPNYKSHKKELAPAPSSFFQFLYNLKINFLYIVLMGEGFQPFAVVVVEERFWGFNWYIPFKRGVRGVLPWKILENLECRKSHLPRFWDLFFMFLFFINQFSLFFSAILKIFQVILYILSPHYSLISNFFAYYSLISIEKWPLFSNQYTPSRPSKVRKFCKLVREILNIKRVREKSGNFIFFSQNTGMCCTCSWYFDHLKYEKCWFFLSLAWRYENLLILEHSVPRNYLRILFVELGRCILVN